MKKLMLGLCTILSISLIGCSDSSKRENKESEKPVEKTIDNNIAQQSNTESSGLDHSNKDNLNPSKSEDLEEKSVVVEDEKEVNLEKKKESHKSQEIIQKK